MTKKPSEKNKAWEKNRRDKLNKSFEELAKLLPKYDPSISWSKIEIIQKSVSHIEDLHQRHENYLKENDPEILKDYKELLEALNYFQLRNGQLVELLKKAKISLPPFKLPKYLVDNPQHHQNGFPKEITTKPVGRPGKYSNNKINGESVDDKVSKEISTSPSQLNLEESNDNEEFNSNSVTKQSSEESEGSIVTQKPPELPTRILVPIIPVQTLQAQTPLQQNPAVTEINLPIPMLPPTIPLTCPQPTIIKLTTTPNGFDRQKLPKRLISHIQPKPRKIARDKNGRIKILPQQYVKVYFQSPDGKVPIPVLRRHSNFPIKRKRRRKKETIIASTKDDKKIENETKRLKLDEEHKEENTENKNEDSSQQAEVTGEEESTTMEKGHEDVDVTSKEGSHLTEPSIDVPAVDEENSIKETSGSVSPTAAFLLSFPVVTTSFGTISKNSEPIESCTSNKELSDNKLEENTVPKNSFENAVMNDQSQELKKERDTSIALTVPQISVTTTENISNKNESIRQISYMENLPSITSTGASLMSVSNSTEVSSTSATTLMSQFITFSTSPSTEIPTNSLLPTKPSSTNPILSTSFDSLHVEENSNSKSNLNVKTPPIFHSSPNLTAKTPPYNSSSVVETTWCSLNTIPSTVPSSIQSKSVFIPSNQTLATLGPYHMTPSSNTNQNFLHKNQKNLSFSTDVSNAVSTVVLTSNSTSFIPSNVAVLTSASLITSIPSFSTQKDSTMSPLKTEMKTIPTDTVSTIQSTVLPSEKVFQKDFNSVPSLNFPQNQTVVSKPFVAPNSCQTTSIDTFQASFIKFQSSHVSVPRPKSRSVRSTDKQKSLPSTSEKAQQFSNLPNRLPVYPSGNSDQTTSVSRPYPYHDSNNFAQTASTQFSVPTQNSTTIPTSLITNHLPIYPVGNLPPSTRPEIPVSQTSNNNFIQNVSNTFSVASSAPTIPSFPSQNSLRQVGSIQPPYISQAPNLPPPNAPKQVPPFKNICQSIQTTTTNSITNSTSQQNVSSISKPPSSLNSSILKTPSSYFPQSPSNPNYLYSAPPAQLASTSNSLPVKSKTNTSSSNFTHYTPSITPLPPPLLSTSLPIPANSFSTNYHPSSAVFGTDFTKTMKPSSVQQDYSKIDFEVSPPVSRSKSSSTKAIDTTSAVTPVYTPHTMAGPSLTTNSTFNSTSNAFCPSAESIYSPVKNYYYPIQMQDTANFSFCLTSTTSSVPSNSTATSQVQSQRLMSYSTVKSEIPWIPPPVTTSNYKTSFTFSLTPATTTYSTVSCSNTSTSRSVSTSSAQKITSKPTTTAVSKTREVTVKSNLNANATEVSKSGAKYQSNQSAVTSAPSSYFPTNFTFALTQSKNSLVNSENSGSSGKLVNEHHSSSFDRYTRIDSQAKQNVTTSFTFALTKTTLSSSSSQRGSTGSFSIDATLNQQNCYGQNSTNYSKSGTVPTSSLPYLAATSTSELSQSGNGIFKKPLESSSTRDQTLPPPPLPPPSSLSSSNQSSLQSYYSPTCDQKLQKPSSSSIQKTPVNWMTPTDFAAPTLIDYSHSVPSYPGQIPQTFDYNSRKNDLYYPSFPTDDNFPSWSPSKVLDTSHLSTPTNLGNYYGDMAFNNTTNLPSTPIQAADPSKSYTNSNNNNKPSGQGKVLTPAPLSTGKNNNVNVSSCSQNNFFSVSQLVDQESSSPQKNYENCNTNNSSSSNGNATGNKKISLSNKSSKEGRKFSSANSSSTYSGVPVQEQNHLIYEPPPAKSQQGTAPTPAAAPITSNNYSTEALLNKKEKSIRNYSNVCSTDFYNMNAPPNTLYSSSTSSLLAADNVDPNYFYNYATNSNCLPADTDYLGSMYSNEMNYSKSNAKSIRKISSSEPLPQSSAVHPPPPAPHPNFVPYDTNYYPVPLGVNSPLMPTGGHHSTADPYGGHYVHPPPGNFQATHAWSSTKTATANAIPHHSHYHQQQNQFHHHQHHQQQQQQQQHQQQQQLHLLPPSTNNTAPSVGEIVGSGQSHSQNPSSGNQSVVAAAAAAATGNLTNFNLTTICPEINNDKVGSNPW